MSKPARKPRTTKADSTTKSSLPFFAQLAEKPAKLRIRSGVRAGISGTKSMR